ncbi:MAG: dihydrodipicolinate synthase family protein [Acidimicrobiales bacterium]
MAAADPAPFTGVAVALVTLFDADGVLDAPATAGLAAQLVDLGISGVLVAGSTGEAWALTADERTALIDAVRAALPPEVPVIAGTGAPTAAEAAAFSAAAADHGTDALLVLSPPGTDDPRPYYDEVAKAAGGVPVIAYHFPLVSPPGLAVDVLNDLPAVACKDSSGDVDRLRRTLATYRGHVYPGSSRLLTLGPQLGVAGAIDVLANCRPEQVLAAFGGDEAAQEALGPLFDEVLADFPAAIKRMSAERFGTSTATRPR